MSKQRAKGTEFENRVVEVLLPFFDEAQRLEFSSPLGDIGGLPIVIECKNHQSMALADWMNQAERSGERVGKMHAVVHKRRGKNARKAYVTQDLEQYAQILYGYQRYLQIIDNHPGLA